MVPERFSLVIGLVHRRIVSHTQLLIPVTLLLESVGPPKVRKKYCMQSLSEKNEEFYYIFFITV